MKILPLGSLFMCAGEAKHLHALRGESKAGVYFFQQEKVRGGVASFFL